MYVFIIFFWIAGIVTWQGYISLLPAVAMTIESFALWNKNTTFERWLFFSARPGWISYNALVGSYAGLATELLIVISLLIAAFRYLFSFIIILVLGVGLEAIFAKLYFKDQTGNLKKHRVVHFKLSRYFFLLLVPILDILLFTYIIGASIIIYFIIFSIVGTILEYCIGYAYHLIVGRNLWTYNQYSLHGYTSILSIPLWGMCGVLMYLIINSIQ